MRAARRPLTPTARARRDMLVPYWSFMDLPADAQEASDRAPPFLTQEAWQAKDDKAYWRGRTSGTKPKGVTGGVWNVSTWRDMDRYHLVKKCLQKPDLCDAHITGIVQVGAQVGGWGRAGWRVRGAGSGRLLQVTALACFFALAGWAWLVHLLTRLRAGPRLNPACR